MSDIINIQVSVPTAGWIILKPQTKDLIERYAVKLRNMGPFITFKIEGPRWEEIAKVEGICE